MQKFRNKKSIAFLIILAIAFTVYFSLFFTIIAKGDNYNPQKSDAILVLGYSLDDDQKPSIYLENRLEEALTLYNDGYAKNIIVSGGTGPTDAIPVAVAMKKWFIEKGIPSDLIFTETKSNNTYENFVFSKQICSSNNIDSVIVVTDDFHMYRSMLISDEFFNQTSGQESSMPLSPKKLLMYIKEPLSLAKYELINKNSSEKVLTKKDSKNSTEEVAFDSTEKYNQYLKDNNTTSYDIKLLYDEANNQFIATEKVTYTNTSKKDIDLIKMNLYHRRLSEITGQNTDFITINQILLDNNKLNFVNNGNSIDISIPSLKPNNSITFELSLNFTIPKLSYITGSDDNAIWASDFIPVIAEFKNDEFVANDFFVEQCYNDMSVYSVELTTNSKYSAILPSGTTSINNGTTNITTMNKALLRNLSFAISKDFKKTTLKTDYSTDISFFAHSDNTIIYSLLHIIEKTTNFMSANIGTYPYANLNVIEVSLDKPFVVASSGMIFVDKEFLSNPKVKAEILYGVVYQWFGSVIHQDPEDGAYITIGLSRLISDTIYNINNSNDEHFLSEYNLLQQNYDILKQKSLTSNDYSLDDYENYYYIKHLKSKLMLYSLQNKMKDNWIEFLRTFYKSYSFNIFDKNDFEIMAQDYSKNNLNKFFNSWLTNDELIDIQGGSN